MTPPSPNVDELMTTYAPALLRYAERLVRNPHAAQDVVQNVFIRYARLMTEKRPEAATVRSWLYRVTHNQAVDLIRAEQRRKTLHETHAEEQAIETDNRTNDRKQAVLDHIHVLGEKEKAVLILRLEEGLSYREISEVTGFKEGHVGYLLHQAVRTLSESIQTEEAS
jgi:RNA polymerase sigma-70 factor (ECF subfamily)